MKHFLILALVFTSLNLHAGAEEHQQSQTCYIMSASDRAQASNEVPTQVCIETLAVDLNNETIQGFSFFNDHLFTNLNLTTLTRKNEDFYTVKASSILKNEPGDVCEAEHKIELKIEGLSDNYGYIDVKELKVSVKEDYSNDSCHSYLQSSVFVFEKL